MDAPALLGRETSSSGRYTFIGTPPHVLGGTPGSRKICSLRSSEGLIPHLVECEGHMAEPKKQPVVSSGIAGLDDILHGGLPASNLYIVQGDPGAGKTTAALQFLRAGLEAGERCIYVSLSQTANELQAIAFSHGWTLDGIRVEELAASEAVNGAADQTIFQTAELRLDETRQAVERAIDSTSQAAWFSIRSSKSG